MEITEKAPAKINLGLNVVDKREDGFHELDMIMASIDLSDRITIKEIKEDKIIIKSDGVSVPKNNKNHAYKAAELIKNTFGIKKGVEIYIKKVIPVAAGLAGGSSDAAATFRALNKLWNLGLSLQELAKLGEEVGSDVPYCIYGGIARVKGRGEIVRPIKGLENYWVLLVKPEFGVSTPDVFKRVDLNTIRNFDMDIIEEAVLTNDFDQVAGNLGNSLEDITIKMHSEIRKIKQVLTEAGAQGVLMSGSGPTVFALFDKKSRATRAVNSIKGFCKEVHLIRSL
ncbi:4-(cytidine 5'-diphospho)-2-C-methyl-D-erythritol kinase [Streptococcaceae bacterium ESL0687]|nr:4-(cytidine 5'-diphospho)-2-C-methyl-D-erythritol kinase [Streptococcaceae bacterium ESL0687]